MEQLSAHGFLDFFYAQSRKEFYFLAPLRIRNIKKPWQRGELF
jgi:hypothetical protein